MAELLLTGIDETVFPGFRPETHAGGCMTLVVLGGPGVPGLPGRRFILEVTVFDQAPAAAWARAEAAWGLMKDRGRWQLDAWTVLAMQVVEEPRALARVQGLSRVSFEVEVTAIAGVCCGAEAPREEGRVYHQG